MTEVELFDSPHVVQTGRSEFDPELACGELVESAEGCLGLFEHLNLGKLPKSL